MRFPRYRWGQVVIDCLVEASACGALVIYGDHNECFRSRASARALGDIAHHQMISVQSLDSACRGPSSPRFLHTSAGELCNICCCGLIRNCENNEAFGIICVGAQSSNIAKKLICARAKLRASSRTPRAQRRLDIATKAPKLQRVSKALIGVPRAWCKTNHSFCYLVSPSSWPVHLLITSSRILRGR
jgi:hypothetical protein